ncbi:MAG: Arm DNA-binding domain-containing protein [Alphaproteobacteria bacterium]|nr:Arm DNA-binding domain-containing protein [Alphaproteobacteria bacterium]
MPLTAKSVEQAVPGSKPNRLYDQKGLYLEVSPTGAKYWRHKYRFAGREKRLSHGVYPDGSLKLARERCDEARRLLAQGIDPSTARRLAKARTGVAISNTFEAIGRAWYEKNEASWSDGHRDRVYRQLHKDLFPWIGSLPIDQIEPPILLACLSGDSDAREVLECVNRRGTLTPDRRQILTPSRDAACRFYGGRGVLPSPEMVLGHATSLVDSAACKG